MGIEPKYIHVEFAPPGAEFVNSLLGTQATGGSTSVRDAWVKLREAGAEARERLLIAGGKALKGQPSLCRIIVGADGVGAVAMGSNTVPFGQVAAAAAALPKPQNIKLKATRDFKFIGKSLPRLDTESKVDGSAIFGIDIRLPGCCTRRWRNRPRGRQRQNFNATKLSEPALSMCCKRSGVAVVADSWWQAKQARDAVQIEWDAGPNAS